MSIFADKDKRKRGDVGPETEFGKMWLLLKKCQESQDVGRERTLILP